MTSDDQRHTGIILPLTKAPNTRPRRVRSSRCLALGRTLWRRPAASFSLLVLVLLAHVTAASSAAATTVSAMTGSTSSPSRPQALVYRGPAAGDELPEAVAQLLESSPRNFEVRFVGPNEGVQVSAENLRGVEIYAQPGGPDLDDAWKEMKAYAPSIRDFVSGGGRYLGFCLGAYLAGHSPGFGLLPDGVDTDSEIDQKGAQVSTDVDTIIQVDWNFSAGAQAGQTVKGRWIYFQEGALIDGMNETGTSHVLARYSKTGDIAASLNKFGNGWVGLIGPHPEATQDWFDEYNIKSPDGLQFEIGYDLIEATLTGLNASSNATTSSSTAAGSASSTATSSAAAASTSSSSASRRQNPLRRLFR